VPQHLGARRRTDGRVTSARPEPPRHRPQAFAVRLGHHNARSGMIIDGRLVKEHGAESQAAANTEGVVA
jgi:hypothetical protein